MIKSVKVNRKNKSIPKGFELHLGKLTVITGENNVGKTNFVKAIDEGKDIDFLPKANTDPKVIYIAANNIIPSSDECKSSSGSAQLIKRLSELFENIGIKFKLENHTMIEAEIKQLIFMASQNILKFSGDDRYKLEVNINNELSSAVIIQSLVNTIVSKEDNKAVKLDDLGQGTQRIIVASMLKAYLDIMIVKDLIVDSPVLILFEEPEVYLHPRLKRALNATLEDISSLKNHQVIITTHDPYFAFNNFNGLDKKIYSFTKENGETKISTAGVIEGIEDELLFILLYNNITKMNIKPNSLKIPTFIARDYIKIDGIIWKPSLSPLENIRNQIHHSGDNPNTDGLIQDRTLAIKNRNYYTEEELSESIRVMSGALAEKASK